MKKRELPTLKYAAKSHLRCGLLLSGGYLLLGCGAFLAPWSPQCYAATVAVAVEDHSQRGLTRDASWRTPQAHEVVDRFGKWFDKRQRDQVSSQEVSRYLTSALTSIAPSGQSSDQGTRAVDSIDSVERLDVIVDAIALVRPDVRRLRDRLRRPYDSSSVVTIEFDFEDVTESSFVIHHVALYYGRWLAQHQFYDEALARLEKLSLQEVMAPATLLFYRGLMEHQLLKKDECLATVKQLLENKNAIPRRYAVVGELMLADIEPLKEDSLDEVARLMNDVGRRTGLNRSGKRVRDQEKTVIDKLDKLIEELEQQQQQQKQQASARSGQGPTKPLKTSQIAGGGANGDVRTRRLEEGGQWGDLPPAQRAAALAEMSKEMPPHYRAVIEEYFRRLADADEK